MTRIAFRYLFILSLPTLAYPPGAADAAVKPNPLISDGMVLQRGMAVPIWGTAAEGEKVTVKFQGKEASTTAKDGRWMVRLEDLKAGGPFPMTIEGENKVEIGDVLVGEVWVCSGQSNMAWPISRSANAGSTIADARDPELRLFTVAGKTSQVPLDEVKGRWQECGPDTVGRFSAVGYFFGRDLRKALGVPVGLINSSVGGTPAEAWTARRALEMDPELSVAFEADARMLEGYPKALERYEAELAKYQDAVAEAKRKGEPAPKAAPPRPAGPEGTGRPACLYNGMIAPLQPFAVRGAIWYQGESNAGRAYQYRTLFPAMIRSWREAWGQGDFPFLFVQLAPFMKIATSPGESAWAELREAQSRTVQTVPRTAMAVITDVGEEDDIHPTQKAPVGARLALAARAVAYGEPIVASGPEYAGMDVEKGRAILHFRNIGSGLVARDGPLKGFTVAGEDRKFVDADAEIHGDTVVVHGDAVERPIAVRYGWANYPVVNLWNKEGLPASPFRTDDFPMTTRPAGPRAAAGVGSR